MKLNVQPRIVDGLTGEVYENMQVAQKAVESDTEPHAELKPKTHYLKLATTYYNDIITRKKTFELRKNDRNYRVGDVLEMHEFASGKATGNVIRCVVKYMLEDYEGLQEGYCILGIGGITCAREE